MSAAASSGTGWSCCKNKIASCLRAHFHQQNCLEVVGSGIVWDGLVVLQDRVASRLRAHFHQQNCLAHTCRLGHIVSNYHCVARLAKDTTGQQVGCPLHAGCSLLV